MTALQWTARNLGREIDLDEAYGPQCVDAVRSFLRDVHPGVDITGDAADVAGQTLGGATWVVNGPHNYPSAGDVVVWKRWSVSLGIGAHGHVAVCLMADPMVLLTADQNWGGAKGVTINVHSYAGVVGWHHFHDQAAAR
jgi:CHAP domain